MVEAVIIDMERETCIRGVRLAVSAKRVKIILIHNTRAVCNVYTTLNCMVIDSESPFYFSSYIGLRQSGMVKWHVNRPARDCGR